MHNLILQETSHMENLDTEDCYQQTRAFYYESYLGKPEIEKILLPCKFKAGLPFSDF